MATTPHTRVGLLPSAHVSPENLYIMLLTFLRGGCDMATIRYVTAFLFLAFAQVCVSQVMWDVDTLKRDAYARNLTSFTLNSSTGGQFGTMTRSYVEMLADIRDRIGSQAGLYPRFLISSDNQVNAFATVQKGQAIISFTLPMLKVLGNDRDAIAAIVGHEIAHLKHNHGLSKSVVAGIFELLSELAGAAIDAKTSSRGYGGVLAKTMVDFGAKSGFAAYSREAEIEADTSGTTYMIQAGFNPEGAVRVHTSVIHMESYDFLSTHPASPARIAAIEQVIAESRTGKNVLAANTTRSVQAGKSVASAVHQTPQNSRPAYAPIPEESKNPELPLPDQVGVVLALKPRHGYLIFSGTTPNWLSDGTQLIVVSASGGSVPVRVSRGIDGYYSAVVSGPMAAISIGDRVVKGGN